MLAILAPVLVFGLVIFVHELGHFIAAKLVGVYAPRFSIGFGPSLFRHRWGETEYVLAALPLGGYVRMASRLDEEMAALEGGSEGRTARREGEEGFDPDAMIPFGPRPIPENRLFETKPLPARLLILFAGVTMNIVLALALAIMLALHYGGAPVPNTRVVGDVHPLSGAPALQRLDVGDTILAVNGKPVRTWGDVGRAVRGSKDTVTILTQRAQVRVAIARTGHPSPQDLLGAIQFYMPPVMDTILPGEPAQRAGFRRGDSVVAIDGKPVRTWSELVDLVSHAPGTALGVVVRRNRETVTLSVTPKAVVDTDPETGTIRTVGKIGAGGPRVASSREPLGVGQAVVAGGRATVAMAGTIVVIVKRLLVGQLSVRQLSGPVGITRMSVEAARSGAEDLFWLIALLSVNVAILNLFPIPILDGGQILINVLESAKGKPFSLRTREYILRFGLLAIALLFVVVMYNDTRGWLLRLVGWVARLFG